MVERNLVPGAQKSDRGTTTEYEDEQDKASRAGRDELSESAESIETGGQTAPSDPAESVDDRSGGSGGADGSAPSGPEGSTGGVPPDWEGKVEEAESQLTEHYTPSGGSGEVPPSFDDFGEITTRGEANELIDRVDEMNPFPGIDTDPSSIDDVIGDKGVSDGFMPSIREGEEEGGNAAPVVKRAMDLAEKAANGDKEAAAELDRLARKVNAGILDDGEGEYGGGMGTQGTAWRFTEKGEVQWGGGQVSTSAGKSATEAGKGKGFFDQVKEAWNYGHRTTKDPGPDADPEPGPLGEDHLNELESLRPRVGAGDIDPVEHEDGGSGGEATAPGGLVDGEDDLTGLPGADGRGGAIDPDAVPTPGAGAIDYGDDHTYGGGGPQDEPELPGSGPTIDASDVLDDTDAEPHYVAPAEPVYDTPGADNGAGSERADDDFEEVDFG